MSLLTDRWWAPDPIWTALSHRELSTTGGTAGPAPDATDDQHGEPAFLFGALGNVLGPVHLGLELRPAHLGIGFPGGHQDIDFLMNADLVGALQKNGWTAYVTVGREPPNSAVRNGRTQPTAAFISYEHWISYQTTRPRTNWNVNLSYYHDHAFGASTSTLLAQLHLYL